VAKEKSIDQGLEIEEEERLKEAEIGRETERTLREIGVRKDAEKMI